MPTPEIEEFAKLLVREVRDSAIRNCDLMLSPASNAPVARRWREASVPTSSGKEMIPDCIDDAVFYLLRAIDEGIIRLHFVSSNGRVVDLTTEGLGELAGWYAGSGGWRADYSEERYVDDFADLAP